MSAGQTRILVLGATGMLGNAMLRVLAADERLAVTGTVRSTEAAALIGEKLADRLLTGVDAQCADGLAGIFAAVRPAIVVNCIGLVKQLAGGKQVLSAVPVNTMLPHRLARLCEIGDARLIHFSTDCVFSGIKGNYVEGDAADAADVYGLSKFLGEVRGPNAITLRTSMIGHELASNRSLIDWFLAQKETVKGFTRAIFSGLPTVELARIVHDLVIPRPDLSGLYHVSAEPIDKFTLLRLVGQAYGQAVEIVRDDTLVIDRSLDSTRFRTATGYAPPSWPELVARMQEFG